MPISSTTSAPTRLVLAQFCARADNGPSCRRWPSRTSTSTPRSEACRGARTRVIGGRHRHDATTTPLAPVPSTPRASTAQYLVCGAAQLVLLLGAAAVTGVLIEAWLRWVWPANGVVDTFLRSAPVRRGRVRLVERVSRSPRNGCWSDAGSPATYPCGARSYLRFWTVKTLIRTTPMVMFVGSPLYVLYLRALGARIGRGVTIFSADRAGVHRPANHRQRHPHP